MIKAVGLAAVVAVCVGRPVVSQQAPGTSPGVCYHARPKPTCSAFLLTNAGLYWVLPGAGPYASQSVAPVMRADWGIMWNIGARDAVGGALFAALDKNTGGARAWLGPAARYRHWLSESGSLDVGLGVAAWYSELGGSLFGVVKVSPNRVVGVALRPEFLRSEGAFCADPPICSYSRTDSHWSSRVALGVELGDTPGLVATLVFGLVVLVGVAVSGGN